VLVPGSNAPKTKGMSKTSKNGPNDLKIKVEAFFSKADLVSAFRSFSRTERILSSQEWWQDERSIAFTLLPNLTDEILKALAKGFFYQRFKNASFHPDVLKRFLEWNTDFALEQIRFHALFLNPEVLETVRAWQKISKNLKTETLLKQFDAIVKVDNENKKLIETAQEALSKFNWLDLMCLLGIWWEWKRLFKFDENPERSNGIPPGLGNVVGNAIRLKLKSGDPVPQWTDGNGCMLRFMEILKLCRNHQFWFPFERAMENLMTANYWESIITSFACQGHWLLFTEGDGFMIVPESPEKENKWNRLGEQYSLLQDYYYKAGFLRLPPEHRGHPLFANPLNPGHQVQWEIKGIPSTIKLSGKEINSAFTVLYLTALGEFHKERYYKSFEESIDEVKGELGFIEVLDSIEKGIFGTNLWIKPMMGPVNFATSSFAVRRVCDKIHFHQEMNQEELKASVDFLSLDMTSWNPDFEFNLQEFPFIKFGDIVCWFTSNLVLNNPAVLFENRVYRASKSKMRVFAKEFEGKIESLFRKTKFETRINIQLPDETGNDKTEIDVLAWRDNQILILQAKNTYQRWEIKSIEEHKSTLDWAGEQLDKSIEYIKANTQKFLDTNQIPIKANDLQIFGLVVSATQEGNYEKYGAGKFSKIGISELEIILHNSKQLLVNWDLEALALDLNDRTKAIQVLMQNPGDSLHANESMQDQIQAARIRQEKPLEAYFLEFCKLWKGNEATISELICAIETDWVWQGLIFDDTENETPSVYSPEQEKEAFKNYESGMRLFKSKKFSEALNYFNKSYEQNPTKPVYLRMAADSIAEAGSLEAALNIYDALLIKFPNDFLGHLNRAGTLVQLNRLEESIPEFETALKINPNSTDSFLALINVRDALGYGNMSEDEFQRFLKVSPLEPTVFAPRMSRAFRRIQELEKIEKPSEEELLELSQNFFSLFNFDKALMTLNRILDRNPNHLQAIYNRGWFKIQKELVESALSDFERALKIDPEYADAWDQAGNLYQELGRMVESKLAHEKSISILPDVPRFWLNYGVLLADIGENEKSIGWLGKAIPDRENGINALLKSAEVYEKLGKKEKAMETFHKAVMRGANQAWKGFKRLEFELKKP
jgi:tetratricopeptide (TPR) repeat protein